MTPEVCNIKSYKHTCYINQTSGLNPVVETSGTSIICLSFDNYLHSDQQR